VILKDRMFLLGAICLLVRQQIMEARRLWQHTALEGALGQLSRRDSIVSSPARISDIIILKTTVNYSTLRNSARITLFPQLGQ